MHTDDPTKATQSTPPQVQSMDAPIENNHPYAFKATKAGNVLTFADGMMLPSLVPAATEFKAKLAAELTQIDAGVKSGKIDPEKAQEAKQVLANLAAEQYGIWKIENEGVQFRFVKGGAWTCIWQGIAQKGQDFHPVNATTLTTSETSIESFSKELGLSLTVGGKVDYGVASVNFSASVNASMTKSFGTQNTITTTVTDTYPLGLANPPAQQTRVLLWQQSSSYTMEYKKSGDDSWVKADPILPQPVANFVPQFFTKP